MAIALQTLLLIWELPQNLLGASFMGALRTTRRVQSVSWEQRRLFIETPNTGVSLGLFVFWTSGTNPIVKTGARNKAHEYGHSIQSRLLGPLYLPLVGVPSVSRVIYATAFYRIKRRQWRNYYKGYPENWADRLGGVERG